MANKALFPTWIAHSAIQKPSSRLHKDLTSEALLISKKDSAGVDWSKANYRGGFTSYGSMDQLHRFSSTFESLEKKIRPQVKSLVAKSGMKVSIKDLKMTRMWVNIMGPDCSHAFHIHPLSVISGSYYLSLPKGAPGIKFEDPRMGLFMARPLSLENYLTVHPKPGDIVIFESWLKHEVPPNGAKQPRMSISFNYDWV
jgi:uncharacterized protein (TIGR02466 family)